MSRPPTRPIFLALAACALASCAWWALAPLDEPDFTPPDLSDHNRPTDTHSLATLDLSAFQTPLWVAPLPPPPTPTTIDKPQPKPRPLRLQLLAIVGQPAAYSAVLYDPDADTIIVAREGETLAEGRRVEQVTDHGVRFASTAGTQTLSLADGREGAKP